MAKMKNLFVGCPVEYKGRDSTLFVLELDHEDATVYCSGEGGTGWYASQNLRISKWPDPDRVIYLANRQIDKQAATV